MRILVLYSFLCLVLYACSGKKDLSITGKYEVRAKTPKDRLLLRKMKSDGRIIGSSLHLKPDSTFLYHTCGNEMTGLWKKKQDSILLYVETNVYRSDSMRTKKAIIHKEPLSFHIRNAQLYRVLKTSQSKNSLELLTKIN